MRKTYLYYCDREEACLSGFHNGVAEAVCLRANAGAIRHGCDEYAILAYGREVYVSQVSNPNARKAS